MALIDFAPEKSPVKWLIVNSICFLSSLILFIEFLYSSVLSKINGNETNEGEDVSLKIEELYIVWVFLTTAIWCVEACLNAALEKYEKRGIQKSTVVELVLAAYFLLDSLVLLFQWKLQGSKEHDNGGLRVSEWLDALGNSLIYFYMMFLNWNSYKKNSIRTINLNANDIETSELKRDEQATFA